MTPLTNITIQTRTAFIELPVNPDKIVRKMPVPHDAFNIVGKGQVAIPKQPDLKSWRWEGFLPLIRHNAPYENPTNLSASTIIKALSEAAANGDVCTLTISRTAAADADTVSFVTVKAFDLTDTGGTPLELSYSIELQEWRDYSPTTLVLENENSTKVVKKKKKRAAKPVIRVGAKVIANGKYCYDSYGAKPHGTASNLATTIKRIVPGREYPILIGTYGWTKESNIQVKG